MQEVTGSIPVFSTKKALYFVGSMVLFFFLKPIFGGCIASPAPFSGFCRRFLYNPQLLTLHRFQKRMFAARFFSRLLHTHIMQYSQLRYNESKMFMALLRQWFSINLAQ